MQNAFRADPRTITFIRAVINAFPPNVCVLLKGENHNWLMANDSAAKSCGFADSEGAIGKTDDDTWATPSQIEQYKASDRRALAGNEFIAVIETQTRDDGLHYLEGSKRVVHFEGKDYLLACWIDVTELVGARDEARRRRDLMALELDVVTHDAASALRAIKNMPYLIRESLADRGIGLTEEEQRFFDRINKNVDRAERLNSALAKARQFEEQKLECILSSRILAEAKTLFPDHEVSVHLPQDFTVLANMDMLIANVFSNLISNAIKYGGNTCRIVLSATKEDDDGVFSVKNTGSHVDIEHADRIFMLGMGSRLNASIEGTGVGLFQARRAVDAMGGRIWLVPTVEDFEVAFRLRAQACLKNYPKKSS